MDSSPRPNVFPDSEAEALYYKFLEKKTLEDDEAYTANKKSQTRGMTPEQCVTYYDLVGPSGLFEECSKGDRCRTHILTAQSLADYYPEDRADKLILDVAAGVGALGQELYHHGFRRLHALDPSEGMLQVARQKNVHEKFYCCFLNQTHLPIEDDVFDCAVVCGGLAEGHIPIVGLYELVRIVKPGGLVTIAMTESYLTTVEEYHGLEAFMAEMEREGRWRQLSRKVAPNYLFHRNGVIFQFLVC